MSRDEWEALCDGCARCCLMKLEDIDNGDIAWTNIACRLLDRQSCRCIDYEKRQDIVPDCVAMTPKTARTINWLPPDCAYRLLSDGRSLPDWHPLVTGDPQSVHRAGASVRGRTMSETEIDPDDLEDYVVDWPGKPAR